MNYCINMIDQPKIATGRFADIANRLRAVRGHFGLSSKDFSEMADVSAKSYSQWESGDIRISIDGAIKLREKYGISLDFIYTGRLDTLPSNVARALASSPAIKATSTSTVNPDTNAAPTMSSTSASVKAPKY